MSTSFLHGIEVIEVTDGARPIRTVTSSVIGLIGTAPQADATAFPINTPTLIVGSLSGEMLGSTGTLRSALDGIFDQIGAVVVVIRVEEGAESAETQTNIIGSNINMTGAWAFTGAMSRLGVQPRILIAPGFSNIPTVTTELISVANRLRAVVIADGPNTTNAEAVNFATNFGSDRLYIVDPQVQVERNGAIVTEAASPRVAGLIAKSDNDRGFWWSPSNQVMSGVVGVARPIDYSFGDRSTVANLLNEKRVSTIINLNGYRLWGNRGTASDSRYIFLSERRTADMIFDSIQRGHLWAVSRNITKTYLDDVSESVNQYMRDLINLEAILGGSCWPSPKLNTAANIAKGVAYFDFDFRPPTPAERIVFRAHINNNYLTEILKK